MGVIEQMWSGWCGWRKRLDCRVKQLHVLGCGQHVETVARDCEAGKWDDSRPICLWQWGTRASPQTCGKAPPILQILPLLAGSLPSSVSRGSSVPLNRGSGLPVGQGYVAACLRRSVVLCAPRF